MGFYFTTKQIKIYKYQLKQPENIFKNKICIFILIQIIIKNVIFHFLILIKIIIFN